MELNEAIDLINTPQLKQERPQNWADLGCGSGLFTYALAQYLAPKSHIYAVDKHLVQFNKHFYPAGLHLQFLQADFTQIGLPLHNLDGILMANALHYVKQQANFIEQLKSYLQPQGKLLIVEYDTNRANQWVPFPLPFSELKSLLLEAGFIHVTKLRSRASVFNNGTMYAAISSLPT
ncbi:methyltransferase family protein [Chitinophaga skermanii]|uniref:Methyltransferase family protein n=1 Tax=Chitinophaga skermanii TaxID=331697 RepID=A0A327QPZ5_9BACT|nr:class I SAM-dependent methyltransferase [Chitinophaga skermanii]RAJ06649.1 methyltransferase family protein [Chitinophaga skermanii]